MKQSDRATAASLRCHKREAAIAGNVSRNSKIRQTPPSSQGAWSQGKHKYQRLSLSLENFQNQKGETESLGECLKLNG